MELRGRLHQACQSQHDHPAEQAYGHRAIATPSCRQPADDERSGQCHRLHQEHKPDERRPIEVELFEGDARKLRDRSLHRAQHEHAPEQHPAERATILASAGVFHVAILTTDGLPRERTCEGEQFAG